MNEQMIRSSIVEDMIDAEVRADSMESAIEMFIELVDAICTQAERLELVPSKAVCGTLISYIIGQKYMTKEAVEVLETALRGVEGMEEWLN